MGWWRWCGKRGWAGSDGVGREALTGSTSRSPASREVERTEALWVEKYERDLGSCEELRASRFVEMLGRSEMRQKETEELDYITPISWGFILKTEEDRRAPKEKNKPNRDAPSHA